MNEGKLWRSLIVLHVIGDLLDLSQKACEKATTAHSVAPPEENDR